MVTISKKLLILGIIGLMFSSMLACKKGKDDPFISFRSRDARLKGKWKLTQMLVTETSNRTGPTLTTESSFDGTKFQTKTINGVSNKGTAYLYLTFADKGTLLSEYKFIAENNADTVEKIGTGSWFWLNTDKNKNCVTLQDFDAGFLCKIGMYRVDGLKNNQLILSQQWIKKEETTEIKYSGKWTFENIQ